MSDIKHLFIFGEAGHNAPSEDFVLRIPLGIKDKSGLLSAYAETGRFPEYFGKNWDALNDCLRDFSWLGQRRIVIVHSDLPLGNEPKELSVYLDVLGNAVKSWQSEDDHELVVIFPPSAETVIDHLTNT